MHMTQSKVVNSYSKLSKVSPRDHSSDSFYLEFGISIAPPKQVKRRKDGHVPGEEEETDLIALAAPMLPREKLIYPQTSFSVPLNKSDKMDVDSATEEESDGELSISAKQPVDLSSISNSKQSMAAPAKLQAQAQLETVLATPARSPSSASPPIDPGRSVGRIVGITSPLEDFTRNIKDGDVVSQAVHDLGEVIKDVITKPFSSRRHQEMLECMKEMRNVALQVCNSCS